MSATLWDILSDTWQVLHTLHLPVVHNYVSGNILSKQTWINIILQPLRTIQKSQQIRMASSPMALQLFSTIPSPSLACSQWRCSKPGHITQSLQRQLARRILTAAAALTTAFLVKEAFSNLNKASSFEFRFTVPDQTLEEADAGVKVHARDLLQVKDFIDSKSWKEAQLALRERSSYLKQDLYTIIQAKPGSQRVQLRKLYSILFNNVSRLDYAARDKDANVVQECYNNIVATLDEIFKII